MSIKGDIFKAISKHLIDTIGTDQFANETGLPKLMWVDKNMGQIAKLENFNSFPMPAILIEFGMSEWQTIGQLVQTSQTTIRFYILYENYADSFEGSFNQDQALKYFEFTEAVHKALQNFSGDNFTGLDRSGDEEDNDHNNMIVSVSEYQTIITDGSGSREADTTLIEPPLKVNYNEPPIEKGNDNIINNFVLPG